MAMKSVRRAERTNGETCTYWLAGRCNRNPCGFLHGGVPLPSRTHHYATTAHHYSKQPRQSTLEKTPLCNSKKVAVSTSGRGASTAKSTQKSSPSICKYWMNDNCVHGDKCWNLHSWFSGDGFSTLAKLKEHNKVRECKVMQYKINIKNAQFFVFGFSFYYRTAITQYS